MYKYIEVIEDETKEAILRMDVTEKSDRTIERLLGEAIKWYNDNK